MTGWPALILAGIFELVGVVGFERMSKRSYAMGLPLVCIGFGIGLALLHQATESIPLTIAYAVFTAIGTMGSVCMGVLFWNERLSLRRLFWIGVVVASIVGLKLVGH